MLVDHVTVIPPPVGSHVSSHGGRSGTVHSAGSRRGAGEGMGEGESCLCGGVNWRCEISPYVR
eukprot:107944-Prymnesium_polylepis.2